jgi:hypothetical protein
MSSLLYVKISKKTADRIIDLHRENTNFSTLKTVKGDFRQAFMTTLGDRNGSFGGSGPFLVRG